MPPLSKEKIISDITPLLSGHSVTLGEVVVEAGDVYVMLEVDPAQGASLESMRQQVQDALEKTAGVTQAHVVLTAERKPPPSMQAQKSQTSFSHKISSRPVAPRVKHIVAVASGKGGVGKSTFSANLAAAFAMLGKKTGLLDADIYGASQPLMMGQRIKPESTDDGMIVPVMAHGVKTISMGFFVDASAPVVWRGPMVHSAIQQLFRDVEWGDLDILIVDLPPGTGDAQLSLAQNVSLSGAVIISTPQAAALNEAVKGLRMFEKTNVKILGMVENMSGHICSNCGHHDDIFGAGTVQDKARDMNVPLLGVLPLLPVIREKADAGVPLAISIPEHPVAEMFKNIAARIWMDVTA